MLNHLLYVDPGSGSYLLQVIIAAILGAGFVLKTWWWKIRYFFSPKKKNAELPEEDTGKINEQSGS